MSYVYLSGQPLFFMWFRYLFIMKHLLHCLVVLKVNVWMDFFGFVFY